VDSSNWGSDVSTEKMSMSKSSMGIGTSDETNMASVDSWGNTVFMCVDYTGWALYFLDDWCTLYWGWDGYVVWGINMDWGWYFDGSDYVLDDIIWDIVWFLNWYWLVDNEGFLADTGDWGILGGSSQKGSWDSNVEVSKKWLMDNSVISSNIWPGTVFNFLGDNWFWYMNRDSIWSRDMRGSVWSWDRDGRGCSNWSSSDGGSCGQGIWSNGMSKSWYASISSMSNSW
jgi:hypothetical protein